ncbi:C2 domain-containing protein 5 [Anopheles stephensi]|uniref:C2 domain-containing protein 5 n=1 Tax=Anopheles stephensi TaxID=30069 RepID=UPI0007D370C0|nr:C2 domain-containing protein 5 [Anopheles stephensi]
MPGKVKVKVLAGRNLPVMDRSSDTTDAFVEIKLGNVTYKTDVCRKTLNPHWNSEWYTFEVEDAELQDEPLQIRLMDYDTYTANDAIGKVYINLSPLLHSTSKSRTGKGSITSGWLPVYDTIHGVRGEIHVIVKVDLFTDFNKFRQSSCGVLFFHSSNIPYGYSIAMYHGFVEELVVNDDPEYQWIDKIRTPRASNEARQLAFMKLSAQVQRKIGIKAIEMGANAVIGYMQCYDLEGDVGVVARGIGTAVSLTKINESFSQHIGEEILVEEHKLSGSSDFGDAPRRAIGISVEANNHASGNSPTKLGTPIVNALLTKDSACVPICRRSSDSDLSITPKGSSCPLDKSIGIVRNYGANNGNTKSIMIMNYDMLEMLEYPFFTMTKYPAGIIRYIGATVTARSVKLLERVPNPNEPETRDSWWNEIRTEVRSHARSLGCNVILGYVEQTTIDDDICVLSATGTAAVINLQFGTDMWMADASLNASGDGGAEVGGKEHMTSSLDRQDFDRECSGSREQTPNTVEADGIYDGVSGMSSKCTICHVPYSLGSVNFRINAVKCSMCKNGIVPDVLITTIEIPDGVPVSGRGSLIQAHTCRLKRDLKSEANGKEISDALPFLEYELHKLLVNKLKIKGMNAIFGLRSNITIGEKTIALIATGTAVYLTALPKPLLPQIVDSSTFPDERKLQELQKMVQSIVEQNIHAYQLQCVYDSDAEQLQSSAGGIGPGAREEREGGGKELDLVCMQKSACVLELDDIFDLDLLTFEKEPEIAPDGFYVVNLQTMPGISTEVLDNVRQFQMFTQVWRAKLPYSLQHTTRNLNKRFQGLLKLIYYKLRSMRPCVLCDLRYKLDFPEPDEIQIVVSGMTLGLGDGTSRLKRKCSTQTHQTPGPSPSVHGNATREHSAPIRSSNDDDMMFSLDEDSMDTSGPPSSASAATTPVPSIVKSFKTRGTKSMTSSSYHSKINRSAKMIPLKDGYGVDITTLSYIPGGKIEKYLGNLNFFFIRECTSIRETGGICGFVHSFISEVLSIVRAHVTSLGGNAMIAFYLNDLTLLDNVHKNQGQCLISVGGDVVFVSFHKDDK